MSDKHATARSKELKPTSNSQDSGDEKGKRRSEGRKFIGFSERMEMKRSERRNKPRTWIERKIVVPIVIGIAGYAWYVYIGRFCVPMLRRDNDAMGGRGMGVAFTIVFCLLGLMVWWTYIKLLFIHPGFAKHYVQKTPAPQGDYHSSGRSRPPPSASRTRSRSHGDFPESDGQHSDDDDDLIGGTPYAEISPSPSQPPSSEGPSSSPSKQQYPRDVEKHADSHMSTSSHNPPASEPAQVSRISSSPPKRKLSKKRKPAQLSEKPDATRMHSRKDSHNSGTERSTDETAVGVATPEGRMETGGAPPHPLARQVAPTFPKPNPIPDPQQQGQRPSTNPTPGSNEDGLPPPAQSRRPPMHPVLLPEYRYCYICEHVKPMRAHHCRACGTCVLMYDHHCPWIGQCVGAHNHKFFVNFLEWSTPWTLWIFATLLGLQIKSGRDIDPQIIVIIAFSGFFSIFTAVLLVAHIRMIIVNQTSVESMGISSIRERERFILSRMVPLWNWSRRNTIRKEWDREWGKLNTEGNIWWLGDARTNWEYRMGKGRVGWILPIGKSEGDGLTYPTNPRFGKDGRWRRRREWPPELQ